MRYVWQTVPGYERPAPAPEVRVPEGAHVRVPAKRLLLQVQVKVELDAPFEKQTQL